MSGGEYQELKRLMEEHQTAVLAQLGEMSQRGARQDEELGVLNAGHRDLWVAVGKLNRWTLIPDDYDPLHPPPGMTRPRDIKNVVREANSESIRDALSIGNLTKVLGLLSLFLVVLNQIAERL